MDYSCNWIEIADEAADDLEKSFPEDTLVQFNYLPSIRGKLALNKGGCFRSHWKA